MPIKMPLSSMANVIMTRHNDPKDLWWGCLGDRVI